MWSASDLDVDPSMLGAAGARTSLESLTLPSFEGVCEFIQGEDLTQAAGLLVERLRSEKII